MMIEGGKLIDIVFINSLLIKINVSRLEAFIISLIFVSDGLIKIVINVIIKKKIVEYFRLFLIS
ncbi:hypothetical protein A4A82_12395 [Staphylococcus cohnii]|nr:hypothetical protein A4A82_12395 [Staphylococcus cohnii]